MFGADSNLLGVIPAKSNRFREYLNAPNKRLERTRHNRSFIRSNLGEALKRSVRLLQDMRVGDEQSFADFEFKAREADGSPQAGAVSCSVIASSNGFCGTVSSVWFSREDLDNFLSQLEQLERTRHGLLSLPNLSSLSEYNPLTFEIFSIDQSGHLAVKVELLKITYQWADQDPSKVSISFPLDGERFGSVVAGFRELFA